MVYLFPSVKWYLKQKQRKQSSVLCVSVEVMRTLQVDFFIFREIEFCNDTLRKYTSGTLARSFYVCERHFANHQFIYICSPFKKRIKHKSIPEINPPKSAGIGTEARLISTDSEVSGKLPITLYYFCKLSYDRILFLFTIGYERWVLGNRLNPTIVLSLWVFEI